ncbi:unnamed protein product [Closterium sp. Naga37s-1]|nr:unnamed protein product [Closterium sp. Naga37s-1]
MKTLASSIHATPCPLPVPSSFRAKVNVASPGQRPESPPQAVPTKEESCFKPVDWGELVSSWPTPFPLENGGSRSPAISIGDDEGEYPLTLKEDAADEEMQEPELG